MATFEIFRDAGSYYRWRLKAVNNEIVTISSESYSSKQGAENSVAWVKTNAPTAAVEDLTQPKTASRYW